MKLTFVFFALFFVLNSFASEPTSKNYKFDLMDDIFDLDLEQLKNMKLSTASKSLQALNKAPARVVIITKEQIEQRGYKSLDDILNDLAGIQILRYADQGVLNQISIRGIMGNNYFKILQDGIEIDQTDGEFMSIAMQYPLMGIEKVEILYGAASVIYGADAMSGVINLVSSSQSTGQAGVWVANDGYQYFYANKTAKLYGGLFSIKAHYHKSQENKFSKDYLSYYTPKAGFEQDYTYRPQETKSASLRYAKGGFEAGVNYAYSSESTQISLSKDNVGRDRNIFDKDSNINSENISAYLRYKTNIFWDMSSTTTLTYSSTEILDDTYFRNRYTGCKNGDYTCMEGYQRSKSQKYGIEETLNKQLANHDITFGVALDYYNVKPLGYQASTKSGDKYYLIQVGRTDDAYSSDIKAPNYDESWHNIAFYLQDQIKLSESVELSLATRYYENSNYESSFVPRVALIHSNDYLTQKLIYSQAFLAPSSNAKYKTYGSGSYIGGNFTMNGAKIPNPDLQPEKSQTYEYNLFIPLSRTDDITLSIYYTNIEDMILLEESVANTQIGDVTYINPKTALNAANSKIYGADISYMGRAYFTGYDMSYWLNYSYINGDIDYEVDYKLPFLASHIFKAGATFRYKDFTLSPSLKWSSPIRVAPYDDVLDERTKGYFIANLYTSYNITKAQKVSLKIDNIFNEKYITPRYNSSERYASPQDTRMFYLAYNINF